MSVEIQPVGFLHCTLSDVWKRQRQVRRFAGQIAGESSQSAQSDRDVAPGNGLYIYWTDDSRKPQLKGWGIFIQLDVVHLDLTATSWC